MQNAIINVNGEILSAAAAKVSVFDRSYLYGDSLYEVSRTYNGKFFLLKEHLDRLQKSAALCHMEFSQPTDFYAQELEKTFRKFRSQPGMAQAEAYGRLVLSRGVGRICFGLGCLTTATQYTLIVQPVETPSAEQYEKGFALQVVDRLRNHPRALDPAMKSGNYLNSLLAYLESTAEGFDDALLCNGEGHVTEGTTFNIFYVKRGIVVAPPLDIGILDGITRRRVIDLARGLGVEVREARFPAARLREADEVFLSSSVKEVFPVTRVDNARIGHGRMGPVTRKLHLAYRDLVRELTA